MLCCSYFSHLPAYLVASFIKRLSRLALRAPSAGARLSIVLVRNLIVRHPNCSVLLHNPACTEPLADPFIEDESDPAKTHALESSLWEIQVSSCLLLSFDLIFLLTTVYARNIQLKIIFKILIYAFI